MNTIALLEVVLGAFKADYAGGRPVRIGSTTGCALASIVALQVMESLPYGTEGTIHVPVPSDEQRESVVMKAIANAERMVGRTLGTDLPGYFAISRAIAGALREEPVR